MCSPVQLELESLEALAPAAAGFIDENNAEGLQGLFDIHDIPAEFQPEAARQLAYDYARSAAPAWRCDPAQVERVADRLVRRMPDQRAARQEILKRFDLINEGRCSEAFDRQRLRNVLPRLAPDDQRRAVQLMATVAAAAELREYDVPCVLDALSENIGYLRPRDYAEVALKLLPIIRLRRATDKSMDQVREIIVDKMAPRMDPEALLRVIMDVNKSRKGKIERESRTLLCRMISNLTAILSGIEEGVDHRTQAAADYRELREKALAAQPFDAALKTKEFADKEEELLKIGFQRVGDSGYFAGEGYLIHIESGRWPTIFRENLLGILLRGGSKHEDTSRQVDEMEAMGRGDDSLDLLELALRAKDMSPEEQLIEAGFKEEPLAKGIYAGFVSAEAIVCCVHEGAVWFVGRPLDLHGYLDILSTEMHFRPHKSGDFLLSRGSLNLRVGPSGLGEATLDGPLEGVPEDLIRVIEEEVDAETGFRYGGANSTEVIRNLKGLNGIQIDKLEKKMRPGSVSKEGYLGAGESLLDVMAQDNDWVMSRRMNHQDLGRALRYAMWAVSAVEPRDIQGEFDEYYNTKGLGEFYEKKLRDTPYGTVRHIHEFVFHGRRFIGLALGSGGIEGSPFKDVYVDSGVAMIVNVDTRQCIECAHLVPHLIARYGFYEGKGTRFRVSPEQVVKVFGFLAPETDADAEFLDPHTGFVYGGANSTESIRRLSTLNGTPIARIEEKMRPGNTDPNGGSIAGFLGQDESLLEVMAQDNDWVQAHGLTHKALAGALQQAGSTVYGAQGIYLPGYFDKKRRQDSEAWEKQLEELRREYDAVGALPGEVGEDLRAYFHERGLTALYKKHVQGSSSFAGWDSVVEFNLNGRQFFAIPLYSGIQKSPFIDGLTGSREVLIVNVAAKECIKVADLVPKLIGRYGFYEGHGTEYRVEPEQVVKVFGLRPSGKI